MTSRKQQHNAWVDTNGFSYAPSPSRLNRPDSSQEMRGTPVVLDSAEGSLMESASDLGAGSAYEPSNSPYYNSTASASRPDSAAHSDPHSGPTGPMEGSMNPPQSVATPEFKPQSILKNSIRNASSTLRTNNGPYGPEDQEDEIANLPYYNEIGSDNTPYKHVQPSQPSMDFEPVLGPPRAASGSGFRQSNNASAMSMTSRQSSSPFPINRKTSSVYDLSSSSPQFRAMSPRSTMTSFNRLSQYDLNSSHLVPHLGEHASSLMPRIQTIELYRKNAKKSHDPEIEYQLAQYMVQTALLKNEVTSLTGSPVLSDGSTPSDETIKEETKVKRNLLREALGILRKLAERGYPDAQYLLGDIYSTTAVDGKKDLKQSFNYFSMAAKHGHAESAYRAALALQDGQGTSRDMTRALQYYKSAASRGQPGALFRMGIAYFYGHMGLPDTANNRQSGLKWLARAVDAANEIYNQAPFELARIYEVGYKDIVFADMSYAVKLYVRSAELNFVPAAIKLGRAFEHGELDCPQDSALSIHYYTIAALGNDPNAQLSMCAWYMVGAGPQFPRNEDEAFEWALRAAHNGLPKAQYTVGFFYENGIGVERDIFQSTTWYRRAAANGDEKAVERLEKNAPNVPVKDKKECIVM